VRRVTGVTATSDGWPLPGATVTLIGADGHQLGRAAAGPDGRFAVPVDAAGPVTVIVAAAGLDPVARSATLAGHADHDLGPVVLRAASLDRLPGAGSWSIDPAHSIVRATARHLGLSRVEGRFTELSGTVTVADPIENSHVTVVIEAASIDTGNRDRDTHLRSPDFLDVKQFPTLRFRGTGPTRLGDDRWRLGGDLTIRDVTRPVTLDVHYGGSGPDPWGGTRLALTATTELHRADWDLTWNMGLPGGLTLIGPTLRVDLDIQAVHNP
jgi:polyisoprenoid-binding protein YceI